MVRRRHDAARKELVTKLAGATSIAITTGAWTSKAVVSFVTYTSHYVTDDWKLVSHVLETKRFNGSHTAETLAASTEAVLSRFNIAHDTVQCLVHDEAPNQMAASRLLRSQHHWDYQACAAHRLQTCIRHAITASRPVTKLLASSRQLVGHFSHSAKSTEALNNKQVAMASASKSGTPLRVIQDVPTRWNSSFLMLQRLIHLRLPIMAVLEDPKLTKSSHRHLQLKDHQWNLAKEIVAALEAPAKATTVLGGETYCTQTLVVPVAKSLLRGLPLDPRSRSLGFLDSDEDKDELKSEIVRRVCAQITADSNGSSSDDECILEPPAKRPMEEDMSLFFACPSVEPSTTSSAASDCEVEVTQFFTEKQVGSSVDPLDWWRTNADRFPTMARLAKRVLCIPATSVPSERVFSAAGIIVSKLRASLTHENVDALVFLHANSGLQAARTAAPVAVQQLMPRLERFAEEEADDLPPLPDL
ncbi:zinc finger BED domain-containing protein 4-like [Sycon ciliatum]|uniref:zinc finger BED domain-containing protein 4-like n=1 Tax=Sycon ciliatum TaxID=27933 RepID=UPI0031F6D490